MSSKSLTALAVVLLIFSCTTYASKLPEHLIPITEAADIKDFKLVDNAINDLSNSIENCVKSKGNYKKCICQFPVKTSKLGRIIEDAVGKHPDWGKEGKGLYYYDKEKNRSSNVFVSAIKKQLVTQCKE